MPNAPHRDESSLPPRARVLSLHERAEEDLRLIRDTMTRSATFTHISGGLVVGLGVLACIAGSVATGLGTPEGLWAAWLTAAVFGAGAGFFALDRKARRPGQVIGEALLRGAGRRFALGMLPPLAAGALITSALIFGGGQISTDGQFSRGGQWIPGVWLLLYGVALVSGGASSVTVVRVLGTVFIAIGAFALHLPNWGPELLVLGFGGVHLGFGAWIWRRYGG